MLTLDGAKKTNFTKTLKYELPAPWGKDKKKAFIEFKVKPLGVKEVAYKASIDALNIEMAAKTLEAQSLLSDKNFEDAAIVQNDANKAFSRDSLELWYKHCIDSWSSDIQNAGANIEPNQENFMALTEFDHEDIQKVMAKFFKDANAKSASSAKASEEAEEAEVKN